MRINVKENEVAGSQAFGNELIVRFHYRFVQIRTAEIAPSHEEILVPERFTGTLRTAHETAYLNHRRVGEDVNHIPYHTAADYVLNAEFERLGLTEAKHLPAIVRERECYIGAWYGHTGEFFHYVLEFHIVAL